MTTPIAKDGSLVCPEYLHFARRLGCMAMGYQGQKCRGAIEAHHWPPKGSSGVTRDDRVIPLCHFHHGQAQRYLILREVQDAWVATVRGTFMEYATEQEWNAYAAARALWAAERIYLVPM